METAKRLIIVLILAFITTGPAISAESEPELSNTLTASCLLKITSNPAIVPLDEAVIEYLLRSSGVAGKAAKETFGIQLLPGDLEDVLMIEWLANETDVSTPPIENNPARNEAGRVDLYNEDSMIREGMTLYRNPNAPTRRTPESLNTSSEQMVLLRIAINAESAPKPAAQEFMNALIDNLRSTLNNAFNEHQDRFDNRLKLADEETARAEHELRQIQEMLNDISGSRILDRNRILDDIANLRRELQVIEMDRATDQATVETIVRQIDEIQTRSKEQLANDDVIKELEMLLENQTQILPAIKKQIDVGMASTDKLTDIEEKITRTRIELAQRREQLNRSTGGERIAALNGELADRSIRSAQNQAKIRNITEQLREKENLLNKASDYELFSLKIDIAKGHLREVIIWRDKLSRQIRLIQPPVVSVLGAE